MSASSFRHLLALLGDREDATAMVLDRAVELADAEHARLTLAKTANAGRVWMCMCSYLVFTCAPPVSEEELRAEASRRLYAAAALVPDSIPLSTVVLGFDAPRALERLVERGRYDLLVVSESDLSHNRGLRRAIRKLGIAALMVTSDAVAPPRPPAREAFYPRPAPHT